jgi:hypothetical protein
MPLGANFWLHAAGTLGAALLLIAYFLVSKGRIKGDSRVYQGLNVVGSVVLAVYGAALQAWSSMALNVVWALIGIALLRRAKPGVSGDGADA